MRGLEALGAGARMGEPRSTEEGEAREAVRLKTPNPNGPETADPADLRRLVYTSYLIENLNRQIRKTIKTRVRHNWRAGR